MVAILRVGSTGAARYVLDARVVAAAVDVVVLMNAAGDGDESDGESENPMSLLIVSDDLYRPVRCFDRLAADRRLRGGG
jgi:hypothetical protein